MSAIQITKFGVNISGFDNITVRIISPNRGLVFDAVRNSLMTKDGYVWSPSTNALSETQVSTTDTWVNSLIAGVYDDELGVYIITIPATLPVGNDYDVLYYTTEESDGLPLKGDAPYDGRHLVWSGTAITSLSDYVGTQMTFRPSQFGDGLGF